MIAEGTQQNSLVLTKSEFISFRGSQPRIRPAPGNAFCLYCGRFFQIYSAVNVEGSLKCEKLHSMSYSESILVVKFTPWLMLLATSNHLFVYDRDYQQLDKIRLGNVLGMGQSFDRTQLLMFSEKQVNCFECTPHGLKASWKHELSQIGTCREPNIIDVIQSAARSDRYMVFLTERTEKTEKMVVEQYIRKHQQLERYDVSEVQEHGLFTKSRVYALPDDEYVLSLKGQIIAMKKKQKTLMVLDNVSSTSNNDFLLMSGDSLLYIEDSTVFGYHVKVEREKLLLSLVDSFADGKEPMVRLYDGILVESPDQRIYLIFSSTTENDTIVEQSLKVCGIVQVNPVNKLNEMLSQKASANEIYGFAKRYSFNTLDYLKTKWESSKKDVPDILNLLVYVKDLGFMKSQLGQLLNHPQARYSCTELIKIKQRTMQVYIISIIEQQTSQAKLREILKCILFVRKMTYINEFEAFHKLSSFDIKQIKATTFKQHIKLLHCKGFHKRLSWFLRAFKYLLIEDYEQVLGCLLSKMTSGETIKFLINDKFFLPNKSSYWQGLEDCQPVTPEYVLKLITETTSLKAKPQKVEQIRWALTSLMETDWFKNFFFVKHCLVRVNKEQLEQDFTYLKQNLAYDCVMKHLFDSFPEHEVQRILQAVLQLNIIPQSYFRKIQLYRTYINYLEQACRQKKVRVHKKLPTVRDLLKMKSPSFFHEAVEVLGEDAIYTRVKDMYDSVEVGYFDENFRQFVQMMKESDFSALVALLAPFKNMHAQFQTGNQQLLQSILEVVWARCTITSKQEIAAVYAQLTHVKMCQKLLLQLDKFVKCTHFYEFLRSFDVGGYTFQQFLGEIENPASTLFERVVYRYSCLEFSPFRVGNCKFGIDTPYDEMLPLFFYVCGEFGFRLQPDSILNYFVLRMIECEQFPAIQQMIDQEYLKPLVGSTYIYIRGIIVKKLEQQYSGGITNIRRLSFLNSLLDLLKKKDSKHEKAFLNIFEQLDTFIPGINANNIRSQFFVQPPVFFIRYMLTEVPLERLPSFPFEAIFKHLGLRRKGTLEQQDQYIMVQLEIGYHCVRNRLYEFAMGLVETILTRKDFVVYAKQLLCVLAADVCQKMRGQQLQEFMTWFAVMLFRDPQQTLSALKTVVMLSEGELAQFVQEKCQAVSEGWIGRSKLFRDDVEFFQLTKVADEMDFGHHEATYLLMLDLMYVDPELQTYLAIKLPEVKVDKMIELVEKLGSLSQPSILYRYTTLGLYIKLLEKLQPQLIVNWPYFLERNKELSSNDSRVQINLIAAKSSPEQAQPLMKYYRLFMEECGQKAQIVLGQAKVEQDRRSRYYPQSGSIVHISQEILPIVSTKGPILVIDRQGIRQQVQKEIQEAKARYSKKSIEGRSQAAVSDKLKEQEHKGRKSPAVVIQQRVNSSTEKKEVPTRSTEQFIRKFKADVAQRFRLTKEYLNKNRSETSLKLIDSDKKLPTRDYNTPKLEAKEPSNSNEPMKDSLLGQSGHSAQPRASSAPKQSVIKSPSAIISRANDINVKLAHIQKIRANKLLISKFSFSKKEGWESNQQSSKPFERSLAESQSVKTPNTPTKMAVTFQVAAAQPMSKDNEVSVPSNKDRWEISQHIHDQLESFKETDALAKIKKFKHGYDNPAFSKEILRKLYCDIKQPQCFAGVIRLFQKYGKSSIRPCARSIDIFQRVARLNLPFDLRKLFPFEYLFTELDPKNAEMSTFRMIKPKLIEVLDRQNIYIIGKMCSFALGVGKDIEQKICAYYVRKLIGSYLKHPTKERLNAVIAAMLLYRQRITNHLRFYYKLFKAVDQHLRSEGLNDLLTELLKYVLEHHKSRQTVEASGPYREKIQQLRLFSQSTDNPQVQSLLKIFNTI